MNKHPTQSQYRFNYSMIAIVPGFIMSRFIVIRRSKVAAFGLSENNALYKRITLSPVLQQIDHIAVKEVNKQSDLVDRLLRESDLNVQVIEPQAISHVLCGTYEYDPEQIEQSLIQALSPPGNQDSALTDGKPATLLGVQQDHWPVLTLAFAYDRMCDAIYQAWENGRLVSSTNAIGQT